MSAKSAFVKATSNPILLQHWLRTRMRPRSLPLLLPIVYPLAVAADWQASVESYFHFTTDVSQFSASRRLSHDQDPTQPLIESEFANKQDDFVYEPDIEISNTFGTPWGEGDIGIKAEGLIFTENPRFTHPLVGIHFIHELPLDSRLILRYTAIPDLYLGRNQIRPLPEEHSESVGDESSSLADEEVSTHFWSLGIGHRFSDRINARIYSRYGFRIYEKPFEQRDNHFWTIGIHTELEPIEHLQIVFGYHFERSLSQGRHQPELRDDTSYENHFLTTELVYDLTEILGLELGAHYERNNWTTDLQGDVRKGEHEDITQGEVGVYYRLFPKFRLMAEFQTAFRKESFEPKGEFSYNCSIGFQWEL